MGGCESVQEEEVYEYPRRRRRPRTPIVYTQSSRVLPVTSYRQPMMVPTVMSMPERTVGMPAVETPRYMYDYYDDMRYPYHSYMR